MFSGPSGVGKGTLVSRLFSEMEGLSYSVSCTTRKPREGERDGVEYRFVSEEDFKRHIQAGDFLEWASVHGHHYGTLRSDVQRVLDQGHDIVLEIDVQGALQVKEKIPEAVTIFIAPPSPQVLEKRLRNRGTEDEQELRIRLANAEREMEQKSKYDFCVINDNLAEAVEELKQVIRGQRNV